MYAKQNSRLYRFMKRLELLEAEVCNLYKQQKFNKNWRDWIYDNHVLLVANYSTDLANKYNANVELSRVAALLHDIADVKMERDILKKAVGIFSKNDK
jgi:HD superfamily phosphodiesterase